MTTRNHIRFIVTEYGVAELYGKRIRERARSLINIAHPDFREELERQAHELKYL
ncbi:MAG: acetyl-CoA hydrolase/transferase C-terminal domain-containing protein [Anaerolineae bacterium]